jgi:ferredoxin
MSCGLCAEVCPFDAIKMDHDFELATSDHTTMTVDKAGLDRPISYFQTIAPRFWDEVKDSALKKLQGNMKRRSGNIGITPSYIGKAQKAAPAAARPAAATAAAPVAAKPAAPVAAVGKNMSEEKLARLQAIRAANAGKSGGAPAAAVATPAVVVAEADDGVDAPAPVAAAPAPVASSGGLPFSADNVLAGVPANTAMAEDKVERLKSIRSGNLAKRG